MMKLTAGFNSADDYIACVKAGADELFCGYVPSEWDERFGMNSSMNRREVHCCNVQLGSESELQALSMMIKDYSVPVALTLNAIHYTPNQYPFLAETMQHCSELGFRDYIVADDGLLVYLSQCGLTNGIRIHISGEYGEVNPIAVQMLKEQGAKRIIFSRHNTPDEMRKCIAADGEGEYEAFLLNEKCHFHGAFCNSIHCDEMPPLCHVPYRLVPADDADENRTGPDCIFSCAEPIKNVPGVTGCGFCALWKLREAGVTHLKIVGRGNYTEDILNDLKTARAVLQLLEESSAETEYLLRLKQDIFPMGCSRNCYYL